jgi:hypothetical protein
MAASPREKPVHDAHESVVAVITAAPNVPPVVLDRAQFMKMVRDGKIGGADRSVTVANVRLVEGYASATASMAHANASLKGDHGLIERSGQWQLLQETVLKFPVTK